MKGRFLLKIIKMCFVMIVYLIGFMGCGKSTIGKMLSNALGCLFYDTDIEIEKKANKSINMIFEEDGEDKFRNIEKEVLQELSKKKDAVISCGGGIVKSRENIDLMKETGEVIYLEVTPEMIFNRVKNSNNRPLLNGNMTIEYVTELYNSRIDIYNSSYTKKVDGNASKKNVVKSIIECLE